MHVVAVGVIFKEIQADLTIVTSIEASIEVKGQI
jgi:hypothetical protein